MNNAEAILVLKSTSVNLGRRGGRTAYAEALEMAITALENAKNDNLIPEFAQTVQKQALKMQKSDALGVKTGETCSDTISRQAAIEALAKQMPKSYTPDGSHPADEGIFAAQEIYADCIQTLKALPSVQPETCDTCKHGYFGDEQCNDCRVRFTSHYERRTDEQV